MRCAPVTRYRRLAAQRGRRARGGSHSALAPVSSAQLPARYRSDRSERLDRETIHKIKRGIPAKPKDWVGVTPDGQIVTGDADGNAVDEGHISDYARSGAETIPKWVWGLLAFAALIALIVLFATGVGEAALILAGVGMVAAAIIKGALRLAGRDEPQQASSEVQSPDNTMA